MPQLFRRIPEELPASIEEGRILLGFDIDSREDVFCESRIRIYSFDPDVLEIYRKAYGETVETILYRQDMTVKQPDEFLWIGPGTFSQRIFPASYRDDLNQDEAFYYRLGRRRRLRRISHA